MNSVEVIKGQGLVARRGNIQEFERQRVAAYCRVSTDSEDQLSSYKSQVQHYTEFIKSKNEWVFAGIYADEAITGTQTKKREDFQRLINDCMNGEIDLVITKSISRFARNTLDTLRYVRMLKEKNVAVFFEEENINTLTMDGELLLVILSSVAQQEVENISANVKKGLKMKMQRGEIVGFQGCLGYDYHPEDKSLTVNEEEANIVRYIFQRYIEGTGCTILSNELKNLGYKTKRGLTSWPASTVINIIKNEKYKGDLLLGKTFTVDPISKRRLVNFGEEDKFYIKGHHDPIVSEEVFAKAQEILAKRGYPRRLNPDGKREKYSRKYAFSSLLQCGFCDTTLSRRSWHASERHKKLIWQCTLATKKGKKYCPESKGIEESIIEEAFLEAYKLLCGNDKSIVDDFLALAEETLTEANVEKIISRTERDLVAAENKKSKLIDLRLEGTIDDDAFSSKLFDLDNNIDTLKSTLNDLSVTKNQQDDLRSRILSFKAILESNQVLEKFDRFVFESIVEKVVIGGYEEGGAPDPGLITFVFKTGYKQKLHKNNYGIARRQFDQDGNAILPSSSSQTEDFSASSYASANTVHAGRAATKCNYFLMGIFNLALLFYAFGALTGGHAQSVRRQWTGGHGRLRYFVPAWPPVHAGQKSEILIDHKSPSVYETKLPKKRVNNQTEDADQLVPAWPPVHAGQERQIQTDESFNYGRKLLGLLIIVNPRSKAGSRPSREPLWFRFGGWGVQ